jgi:hypothetical protein
LRLQSEENDLKGVEIGGADGVAFRSLKKTEEKPLNSGVYCHLLIFPMSLTNPSGFFGRPYNGHSGSSWQKLFRA